jgi:hypothetical protein|tara:strand:+ start:76 stop:561 length:486 start_codon:yes stop_codon:yes gene_type:complete
MSHNKFEVSKDFRKTVTKLEKELISIADGENIIAGTEENPIITNNEKLPIKHFFMDGIYVREMKMYKGMIVVGAIHKHLHMCFLLEGHVVVAQESGVVEYKAPCIIESTPGIKRVLYAYEDSLWYNTHKNPSNTKDIDRLEKEIVALSYEEYEKYINNKNK